VSKRYDKRCLEYTRAGNLCGLREGHPGKHINSDKLKRNQENNRQRSVAFNEANRIERARWINLLKVGYGCADCPPELKYFWPAVALQFDHLPEFSKVNNVSSLVNSGCSADIIFEEIAKCEVVCANHHAVRTSERRKRK
jgi:hypothetical protein